MRVIPPINTDGFTIASGMLVSSTEAEPGVGEVAWNSATTYAVGDTCYLASTHRRYQSRTDGNLNHDPSLATQDAPSTDWQDIGPTNQWAMFDTLRSTGTVFTGGVGVVEINPGRRVDTVGIAGMENVDLVRVEMYRGAVQVFDSGTVSLRSRLVTSWYEFFFADFNFAQERAFTGLPPYTDGTVRITFTRQSGGDLSVGAVVVGMSRFIGRGLHGADDDATNYSRIDRLFDGTLQITRRRTVPKNTIQLVVDKSLVPRVRQLRDDLNAVPALYIGMDDDRDGYYSALFKLGIYRSWKLTLSNAGHAVANLEVEEF